MTGSKHTPGPWHRDGCWILDEDDDCIGDFDMRFNTNTRQLPLEEKAANAQLAVAAPTLLAILRRIIECEDESEWGSGLCDRVDGTEYDEIVPRQTNKLRDAIQDARDAIRRAEGASDGIPTNGSTRIPLGHRKPGQARG